MCGICGIIDFSDQGNFDQEVIGKMVGSIQHRGPNHSDTWTAGGVALGHARLSIIDLSEAGNQPMRTADGRYVMVFNGEVYNFSELREELERDRVQFKGHSDTEVLLNAYVRWGHAVVSRLNGIFAFAVWDNFKRELILARDRFGVKPLYIHQLSNGIVFGSEIKAVLASGRVSPDVSVQAMHEFSYFGVALGANTLFEGIRRLEPGHWLRLNQLECEIRAYWRTEDAVNVGDDFETSTVKTRGLLEAAVKRQMVSDVPVGVFLSGGIDSSAVTAFASRHYGGTISTYSVGFDFDKGVNELPKARRVAEHFSTDHHELHIEASDMPLVMEELVRCHDEPFSDAGNIPLYLLCRELNCDQRVILQGDGGDELFGGYPRYALLDHFQYWRALSRTRGLLLPFESKRIRRLLRILDAFAQDDPALRMAFLLTQDTSRTSFRDILSKNWKARLDETDAFRRYREMAYRLKDLNPVQQMLFCDMNILLPDVFLEKVDKATMAFGIESRVPFLDNDLVDYVMGIPSSIKVRGNNPKRLLKKAMRGILPDNIIDSPKTGMGCPNSYWLSSSLYEYARCVFEDVVKSSDSFFERTALIRLLEKHKVNPSDQSGFILWKALNLSIWRKQYLER